MVTVQTTNANNAVKYFQLFKQQQLLTGAGSFRLV
jgi:hypothetical protein